MMKCFHNPGQVFSIKNRISFLQNWENVIRLKTRMILTEIVSATMNPSRKMMGADSTNSVYVKAGSVVYSMGWELSRNQMVSSSKLLCD